ncbi:MAG: polysaccharide biosynthesis C-terminal domain-containing protein [Chitinophagaceae bacterium]|nr:polysaccharide biosynthesis C-terminal domain-containing protein [Chitinophagaceae bacterium]
MWSRLHITRDVVVLYAAQVVQVIISFVSSVILARWLGKEAQGEVTLYNTALSFLILVTTLGVPAALVYFLSSHQLRKQQFFFILSLTTTVAMVIAILLLLNNWFVFPEFFPSFFNEHPLWLLVLLLHSLIAITQQITIAILQVERHFIRQSIIQILGNSLYLITLWALYFSDAQPIFAWVIAAMIANIVLQLLIMYKHLWSKQREYLRMEKIPKNSLKIFLGFGLLAFVTNLIQFMNYKMDVWFLNHYFNNKGMIGVYAVAVSLAQMFWLFPQAMQTVLFQRISSDTSQSAQWRLAMNQAKTIFLYVSVLALPAYFLAEFFIPLFYGEAYQETVHLFQWLLVAVLPFCLTMPISAYFAGTGRVRVNLYSAMLGFVVCFLANWFFIPKLQTLGAVWSSILSYGATTLFLLIMFYFERSKTESPN